MTATSSKALWIFGLGNFAEMAHYLFTEDGGRQVRGFVVDGAYRDRDSLAGLPVVAWEDIERHATPEDSEIFVAIGVGKINTLRARRVDDLTAAGWSLASYVSPTARVPRGFSAEPNTMIMDQVNIHPQVTIGRNTVVWSNSRIALKAQLGNHVWVTSAVIGDSSVIGDYTFIGINATVAPFVRVGSHNLIGAAAVINRNTRDYQVYRGPKGTPSSVSSLRLRNIEIIR